MKRLNIRLRLTLWYGAVLATVLAVFGAAIYLMMRHVLRTQMDAALAQELNEVVEEAEEANNEARLQQRLAQRFLRHDGYEFQVSRVDGGVIFRSERLNAEALPIPPIPTSFKRLDFERVPLGSHSTMLDHLGRWRVATELVPGPGGTLVIQAAASLAPDNRGLQELLLVLLSTGPLALAAALGGGYLLARKALSPVDRMNVATSEITADRLDRRIEVLNHDDELGRLARTLNGMIARLERSFDEIRRFTADAAHELRTPLAVLRSEAEVALRSPREPEHYRRVIEDMLEEVERLSRLAEQLLFLCREDAGLAARVRAPVRLDELVGEVTEHMRVVADVKAIQLEAAPLPRSEIAGDEDQLRRLFSNILDNAVKFTPSGGTISVCGKCLDDSIRLVVSDTGIGIPAEHLPHIFDRFYRVDPARGREVDGTGLGLAICRSIVEAHGGEIRIESTVGHGTEVFVTLPLTPPDGCPGRKSKRAAGNDRPEITAKERRGRCRS
jgi:two-component system, OmpR family, heavy metal sensor histidine kinase CusS